ncbi:MAG TPA: hypothetical protein VKA74_11660, partial [Myxococcota bacterium]|nr:hypothetical protein [Myxococcota bacterium]
EAIGVIGVTGEEDDLPLRGVLCDRSGGPLATARIHVDEGIVEEERRLGVPQSGLGEREPNRERDHVARSLRQEIVVEFRPGASTKCPRKERIVGGDRPVVLAGSHAEIRCDAPSVRLEGIVALFGERLFDRALEPRARSATPAGTRVGAFGLTDELFDFFARSIGKLREKFGLTHPRFVLHGTQLLERLLAPSVRGQELSRGCKTLGHGAGCGAFGFELRELAPRPGKRVLERVLAFVPLHQCLAFLLEAPFPRLRRAEPSLRIGERASERRFAWRRRGGGGAGGLARGGRGGLTGGVDRGGRWGGVVRGELFPQGCE